MTERGCGGSPRVSSPSPRADALAALTLPRSVPPGPLLYLPGSAGTPAQPRTRCLAVLACTASPPHHPPAIRLGALQQEKRTQLRKRAFVPALHSTQQPKQLQLLAWLQGPPNALAFVAKLSRKSRPLGVFVPLAPRRCRTWPLSALLLSLCSDLQRDYTPSLARQERPVTGCLRFYRLALA